MARRSVLERDLVSRLERARRHGCDMADPRRLRPALRAEAGIVVVTTRLEARRVDFRSRRSEDARMTMLDDDVDCYDCYVTPALMIPLAFHQSDGRSRSHGACDADPRFRPQLQCADGRGPRLAFVTPMADHRYRRRRQHAERVARTMRCRVR